MPNEDDYLAQEAARYREDNEHFAFWVKANKVLTDRASALIARCKARGAKLSPRSKLHREAREVQGRLGFARRELNKLTGQ